MLLQNKMSPEQMAQMQKMAANMSPDQMAQMQKMAGNITPDQVAQAQREMANMDSSAFTKKMAEAQTTLNARQQYTLTVRAHRKVSPAIWASAPPYILLPPLAADATAA